MIFHQAGLRKCGRINPFCFSIFWTLESLSQCAARLPRHRAFDFGYLANKWGNSKISQKGMQTQLPKTWWQTSGRTQKATKNPSKNLQKSLKMGSWTIPGALGGGSGTSLAPGRPRARKGHQKAAKTYSVFGTKMGTRSNFSWFFLLVFFEVLALQIFHDFGCLRTPLLLPFWLYFESSGPLGKQLKVL